MEQTKSAATLIDEYIAKFPENVQTRLQSLRATIRAAAPAAKEKISYQMPAYALEGNLVYFAGWKNHIGFYPGGSTEPFKEDLAGFEVDKGTIRFTLDKPLPVDLITRIVHYRIEQNREKAAEKAVKKANKKAGQKV